MTAIIFGIHQSTVSKVIFEVSYCCYKVPRSKVLPKTVEAEEVKQELFQFEVKFGLPQAFGAIDVTHLPIQRPTENSQGFFLIIKVFFRFQFKKFVIIVTYLWIWFACGPVHSSKNIWPKTFC